MLYRYFLFYFILVITVPAQAQSYQRSMALEAYRHHMAYADHQISFYTLPLDQSIGEANAAYFYHWWSGKQINVTQGGYSGKLLHGDFNSYFLNKQLKQQGKFNKGLKVGEWKEWNEGGKLIARINYNKGIANGNFYRYNEVGQLSEAGYYHDGKIDGKLKKYIGLDSIAISNYKEGTLMPDKVKVAWWKRFWKKGKK